MIKRGIIFLFIFLLSCFSQVAISQVDNQYSVKAAFIYQFTKYITWKNAENPSTEFVIGILGDSDIIPQLRTIAKIKKIKSKIIVIDKYDMRNRKALDVINNCDILFVPIHNSHLAYNVLKKVDNSTLIIGEEDQFAHKGGAINFVICDNKLKFELNRNALERCGFKVSAQLMKLSIMVDEES